MNTIRMTDDTYSALSHELISVMCAGLLTVKAMGDIFVVYGRYYEHGVNNNSIDRLAQASAGNMISMAALFTDAKTSLSLVAMTNPEIRRDPLVLQWERCDDALRTYFRFIEERSAVLRDINARQQLFGVLGWDLSGVSVYQDSVVGTLLHLLGKQKSGASSMFSTWLHP